MGHEHASRCAVSISAALSRAVVSVENVRCSFLSENKLCQVEGPRRVISVFSPPTPTISASLSAAAFESPGRVLPSAQSDRRPARQLGPLPLCS
jgi:hypothetical protein